MRGRYGLPVSRIYSRYFGGDIKVGKREGGEA